MEQCKHLKNANTQEFQTFFNSFDNVFVDCDGVIFVLLTPVPGAKDGIQALKEANKNIHFVSNNCTMTLDIFHQYLMKIGYSLEKDQIQFPTLAIISYLKSINFTSKIFMISTSNMRKEIEAAGFVVVSKGPSEIPDENTVQVLKKELEDDPNIGAVIVDNDMNVNFIRLSKAIVYLKRPDVLFITAASDSHIPIGKGNSLIGSGMFQTIIKEMSNRESDVFGKPDLRFYEYIKKSVNLEIPERTLFIGDSLTQDMEFATKCGFKKLLVLTGNTTQEDLLNLTDKNKMPNYYLDNVGQLSELIKKHSVSFKPTK